MKSQKRAVRRAHRERLKKNRKHYWGYGSVWNDDMDKGQLGVVVNTPCPCSCWMCGNPRRKWGVSTLKEIRSWNAFVQDLIEVDFYVRFSTNKIGASWW